MPSDSVASNYLGTPIRLSGTTRRPACPAGAGFDRSARADRRWDSSRSEWPVTVLVVDDHRDTLDLFAFVLASHGYRVISAATGTEALERCREDRPDLLLLDVMLPDIDGIEVCRQIKADPDLAPTIVVLASAIATSSDSTVVGLQSGADGYLVKPLEPAELVARVQAFIRFRDLEAAVRESELHLRAVFESTQEGMVTVDDACAVCDANPAAARLLGASLEDLRGRELRELLAGSEPFDRLWGRLRVDGRAECELIVSREGHADRELVLSAWARIRPGLHLVVMRDVTEQRRAEEERKRLEASIQQTQKLESLGLLAGGIAHDFNNLLTAILGHASLAVREIGRSSRAGEHLDHIAKAAARAADLCRQMLAYAGRGPFLVEGVQLSRLVKEMANLLSTAISKGASLDFRLEQDLPLVRSDATQLRQVVMNLITNASDAVADRRGGVIRLTTGLVDADAEYLDAISPFGELREGRYVVLEVSDNGCGIDEETRAKIFDPFFTTKFTGRGLGLAAVLGIVRAHKGAVRVESEVGCGTTFTVLLPAAAETEARAEAGVVADVAPGAGRTILVVDDEEPVRELARQVLERAGYTVLTAADGREGLDVYTSRRDEIAAVLLDMTMPRMNGPETLAALKQLEPSVRVVLTSGYHEEDATASLGGAGLAGFLQKPFRAGELASAIRRAVADRGGSSE
jgi:PAS domain S-box-containing protein